MLVPESTDYKFLSIFADNLSHSWVEIIYLGTIYLNVKQSYTEQLLHRAVIGNGWIKRDSTQPSLKQDSLSLTEKGDLYFRYMSIRRNPDDYRLYKYFNREQTSSGFSSFGMDKIAPLSPNLQRINHNGSH